MSAAYRFRNLRNPPIDPITPLKQSVWDTLQLRTEVSSQSRSRRASLQGELQMQFSCRKCCGLPAQRGRQLQHRVEKGYMPQNMR